MHRFGTAKSTWKALKLSGLIGGNSRKPESHIFRLVFRYNYARFSLQDAFSTLALHDCRLAGILKCFHSNYAPYATMSLLT